MSGDRAREQILAAIRRHPVPPQPLPDPDAPWIRYESPREQFVQVLQAVGGSAQVVADADALTRALVALPAYQSARRRCCEVALPTSAGAPQSPEWNVRLDQVDDPHDLATLDLAVLPGQFGVAENAAVWVTDRGVRQRAAYFIAQHVALVIPADEMVHNMHEAYQRLEFTDNAYGCFISGPSKTADIEQSLVIGAHGPRSLTVLLVEDANWP